MGILNINNVKLSWLGHAGFKAEWNGRRVYIDPFQIVTSDTADLILITHTHYDHLSIADISKIATENTTVILPVDGMSQLASKLARVKSKIMKPGDKMTVCDIDVEAYPAYNIGKPFHPKDNGWMGYIFTINKVKFYHAGDTDRIPEMNSVKADVALLPIGGTYTMDAEDAAAAANEIGPKVAVPMHWGKIVGTQTDADRFRGLCRCQVMIL